MYKLCPFQVFDVSKVPKFALLPIWTLTGCALCREFPTVHTVQVKESYGNKKYGNFGFHPTSWSVHPAYNEHYRQDAAKLLLFSDIRIPSMVLICWH